MQVFMVGGAVRDLLLGRPGSDRDWVVVGAKPEDMVRAGFTPVGRDFPVFLHPQTKEEYALARTERKTSPGYHGFVFHADPSVTLEQDLARRDLTINAMAQDPQGALIDPFGGRRDLAARVLRHVSPAFAEDPVRILRLARFAARFTDFSVAAETLELARRIVGAGEANALTAERVWQELSRGLMEARPSRMLDVLRECGALAVLLPQVDALWAQGPSDVGVPEAALRILRAIDFAAAREASLAVRFACLVHDLDLGHALAARPRRRSGRVTRRLELLRALCAGLRVPVECSELAEVVARVFDEVDHCLDSDGSRLFDLLERCDALRRPQRLDDILLACECIARASGDTDDPAYPQRELLMRALGAALGVPSADIAARAVEQGQTGAAIGQAVRRARIAAIETVLPTRPET